MEGRASFIGLALLLCIGFSDAGVSYVRWGRSVCPPGVHKLFSGYMVGHHRAGQGNGAGYECAVDKPAFVRGQAGHQDYAGVMVGVEFWISDAFKNLFLSDNVPGGNLRFQDMVCARCYVADSTDQFMLTGRQDCYDTGYDLAYKGFIVSEWSWDGRQPTQYVCLDEAPEGRVGGEGNSEQGYIYPVEMECGSLPCNPYINRMEAPCAVCTY